jgi:plastocyanin
VAKVKVIAAFLFSVLLFLAGCVSQNANESAKNQQQQQQQKEATSPPEKIAAVVEMQGREFVPPKLTVHVGDTVQWKNASASPHTVSSNAEKAVSPQHASVPQGAEVMDSGQMAAGATYNYTFKVPGTDKYMCEYHEQEGMVGEVDVQ